MKVCDVTRHVEYESAEVLRSGQLVALDSEGRAHVYVPGDAAEPIGVVIQGLSGNGTGDSVCIVASGTAYAAARDRATEQQAAAERLGVSVDEICVADRVADLLTDAPRDFALDALNAATHRYIQRSAPGIIDNLFQSSPLASLARLHHDAAEIGVDASDLETSRRVVGALTRD